MNYLARVTVSLKKSVLDPQGAAVKSGLASMGFTNVAGVRIGKHMEIDLSECDSAADAAGVVDEMCRKLLANPVIEEYEFEVVEASPGEAAGR
ncbi:MAG: phosphoribosylformylglycinamidine synthase subunit PurS [Ignavibacteriales bacterium]